MATQVIGNDQVFVRQAIIDGILPIGLAYKKKDSSTEDEPEMVWYYRTNDDGEIIFNSENYIVEEYTFSTERNDSLTGKQVSSDERTLGDGVIVFSLGTYRLKEICAPAGYKVEGTFEFADEAGEEVVVSLDDIRLVISSGEDFKPAYELCGHLTDSNVSAGVYDIPYEHSLKIIKAVSNGSSENVAFRLYNETDKTYITAVKNTENVYEVSGSSSDGTLFVPDENGEILITGLPKASYTLSEAVTAVGNSLLAEEIHFDLPLRMTADEVREKSADIRDTEKVYYDEATDEYCFVEVTYNITNGGTFTVPMTGGNGVMITLSVILAVILIAFGLLSLRRRRTA